MSVERSQLNKSVEDDESNIIGVEIGVASTQKRKGKCKSPRSRQLSTVKIERSPLKMNWPSGTGEHTQTKRKRKRSIEETCQACRFSRVRCDNIGQFTKCKRCTRLGLQCLYTLGTSGAASAQTMVGSSSDMTEGKVRLGACEWCKIKKTKCEDSKDGESTCVLCLKHNRTCVRNKAKRGRPLSGYTRRLLVTQNLLAPLDLSGFPVLVACNQQLDKSENTTSSIFNMETFCTKYPRHVLANMGPLSPLLNAMAFAAADAEDFHLVKEFAASYGIRVSYPSRLLSSSSRIYANAHVNDSLPKFFVDSLTDPKDPMEAWIAVSVGLGGKRFQTNANFIKMFCSTKHVDGHPVNSLALDWRSIISIHEIQQIFETALLHYITESSEHEIISSIIDENIKHTSGEYVYPKRISLRDKNNDIFTCIPTIKYDIQKDGNCCNFAFIIKNILQNRLPPDQVVRNSARGTESGQRRQKKLKREESSV